MFDSSNVINIIILHFFFFWDKNLTLIFNLLNTQQVTVLISTQKSFILVLLCPFSFCFCVFCFFFCKRTKIQIAFPYLWLLNYPQKEKENIISRIHYSINPSFQQSFKTPRNKQQWMFKDGGKENERNFFFLETRKWKELKDVLTFKKYCIYSKDLVGVKYSFAPTSERKFIPPKKWR